MYVSKRIPPISSNNSVKAIDPYLTFELARFRLQPKKANKFLDLIYIYRNNRIVYNCFRV